MFAALAAVPKPTIAAVNGYAFGGGFELALCCDLILAADTAWFALPEVKLGLVPGGGGTQRLSRTAGPRFAKEVTLIGRRIRPDEAERRGIVSAVVPAAEPRPGAGPGHEPRCQCPDRAARDQAADR